MEVSIQPGFLYLADLSDAKIPVRAVRPLLERPGWWIVQCCRSETRIRVPATALLNEVGPQTTSLGSEIANSAVDDAALVEMYTA